MKLRWPRREEVERADPRIHGFQIVRWHRFLPSPQTEEQVKIINLVIEKRQQIPEDHRVRLSKAVGWD